jgi:NAD(P)-dependent dehydrogenase (short-subunit alcohol dehydrogenase family)
LLQALKCDANAADESDNMTIKTVLITGCSSGIGFCFAVGLQKRGYRVLATVRNAEDAKRLEDLGLEVLLLDYAYSASVQACAAEVARRGAGKLFALVNNGAAGQPGAVEDISRGVLEKQFAANFFGWHELTILCLPLLRANGGGHIVNVSSVLGLVAFKWRGAYNATKFALEGLTDTLRLELRGSGIAVSTLEPGPIASRFVETALKNFELNIDFDKSNYKSEYNAQRARLGKGGSNRFKLPPEAVLDKLIHAIESGRPKAHYYVTVPTYLAGFARRVFPQGLQDRFLNWISDQ